MQSLIVKLPLFAKANPNSPNTYLERAMGIEPTSKAWEALILPMNYARVKIILTISKI